MISNFAARLTGSLINRQMIGETDRELYEYGLFMLLSNIFLFVITILLGIIFGEILGSIIFFFAFMVLRRYAGGYHAKTELKCQLSTTFAFALCIAMIKFSHIINMFIPLIVVLMLSTAVVLLFAPLDTPEKPLTLKEETHYRIITYIILAVIDAAIALAVLLKIDFLTAPLEAAVILESFLLSIGKIAKENQYTKTQKM